METKTPFPILAGLLLAAFTVTAWTLASQDAYRRSGEGLCQEVDYELGESVRAGLLDPTEALQTSQRCYSLFGDDSND